jgi:chromosome segregation ATPase
MVQVEGLRKDVARIESELEAVKASGVAGEGDINDLKRALEDKQTQLNAHITKCEELETQVTRLTKEKDLINKKMDRVQQQKDLETAALKAKVAESAGITQDQINERDRKINALVEELGNREVMINETKRDLENLKVDMQVCSCLLQLPHFLQPQAVSTG